MTSNEEPNRVAIAEQAAEWIVTNDEGPLGERESAALVSWLKASPDNVEEFLGISVVARDLRAACVEARLSDDGLLARARAGNASRFAPGWSRLLAAVRDLPATVGKSRDGGPDRGRRGELRLALVVESAAGSLR